MTRERWKEVGNYPRYWASTFGRIYSQRTNKYLSSYLNKYGYLYISARRWDGVLKKLKVQWLIMLAFKGPTPEGKEICHNNGIRTNNRLSNLRFDTHSANQMDRVKHGTSNRGERCGSAKLTEVKVREIRVLKNNGMTQVGIAKMYQVADSTVSNVINRKTWVDI